MLRIAHCDDSGKSGSWLVIGTAVATVEAWEHFSKAWHAQLKIAGIGRLKMKEVAAGWSAEKFQPFKDIIGRWVEYAFAIAIDQKGYKENFEGRFARTLDYPIYEAYVTMIHNILVLEAKRPIRDKVELVCDEEDPATERELLITWDRYRHSLPSRLSRNMGRRPVFDKDENVLPLQVADIVAWCYRRSLEEQEGTASKKLNALFPTGFPTRFTVQDPLDLKSWANVLAARQKILGAPYHDARHRSERLKRFVQREAKKKK